MKISKNNNNKEKNLKDILIYKKKNFKFYIFLNSVIFKM